MAISIVQNTKNTSAYQVQPLVATLPAKTTAGSRIVVVIEAQKSGYPFNVGNISANEPAPIVTDDKGNIYTLVDSLVVLSAENLTSPPTSPISVQPDASGYFPSAYIYIANSGSAATTGTQNIAVFASYPDEFTSPLQPGGNLASPPVVGGRPIFDGGTLVQVFEVAGLVTGIDHHGHVSSNYATLGAGLITTSGAAIIFEIGILIDSSAIAPTGVTSSPPTTSQYAQTLCGGSSHYALQSTIVAGAVKNGGFSNALLYAGGVVVASFE